MEVLTCLSCSYCLSSLCFVGSAVTSGVRYILAGFIEYGDGSHETFMESYNPVYDGYAAEAGFRTGDMIVGLEVCEEVKEEEEEVEEQQCSEETCREGPQKGSEESTNRDRGYVRETAQGGRVRRRMEAIGGDLVSDERWVQLAQSCERLDPGADTVIRVRRRSRR